ncbi:hypothetical protein WCP94_004459 [Bilophila wadsworthia]
MHHWGWIFPYGLSSGDTHNPPKCPRKQGMKTVSARCQGRKAVRWRHPRFLTETYR